MRAAVAGLIGLLVMLSPALGGAPKRGESEGPEEQQLLEGRARWWFERHLDASGNVPADGHTRALAQLESAIRRGAIGVSRPQGSGKSIVGDTWLPIGPRPIDDSGFSYAGRVTSIAAHPADPSTVYVGAAQGGVWKTTDGGGSWIPLTDAQDSLVVGAIAIDPSNPSRVYVGTGEPNQACPTYFGVGILKSQDGGATWTKIGASTFANSGISRIVVHPTMPTTLWAASGFGVGGFVCTEKNTTVGVFKSTNGGTTWSQVLGQTQTGVNAAVHDLVMAPGNPSVLYAAVNESGIWKTSNGGTFWTKLAGGLPSTGVGRLDIAIDPSNASVLYVTVENNANGTHLGTWRSTDAGVKWTQLTKPSGSCQYWDYDDVCTYHGKAFGQCWYDLALEVQPGGTLWMGGTAIFNSTDGGATWNDVCPTSVHVDQHAIAFGSDGQVWLGNDGGVWTTADGGASWTNRNANLQITQFYPGASLDPSSYDVALGGTQDNGTPRFTGGTTWTLTTFADGAATAIDPRSPATTWYTSHQYLYIKKTTDGGTSYVDAIGGLTDGNTVYAPFIASFVMCPTDPDVLIAGSDNVWRTDDGADVWAVNSPDPLGNSSITTVAFAAAGTTVGCDTYVAGTRNGALYRTHDGGASWNSIGGPFGGRGINDVAFDPTSSDVLYVALSGFGGAHLYKSTNAMGPAPTWTAVDAGMPDSPINAVLVDPETSSVVYAGGDLGLFKSENSGATWTFQANGIPRLAVYDVVADKTTRALVAFTHGRGAFRLELACTPPTFGGITSVVDGSADGCGLDVTWSAPASWGQTAASGTYGVERFLATDCSDAPTVVAAELPAGQLSYKDATAPSLTPVRYRVVATNDCAAPLASAGPAPSACVAGTDAQNGIPCEPIGDSLRLGKSGGSVVLTWDPVACTDLAGYRVEAGTTPSIPGMTLLSTVAATTATDALASPWTFYHVGDVDSCGSVSPH